MMEITRRGFLKAAGLGSVGLALGCSAGAEDAIEPRPPLNIVFILADDLGWSDVGETNNLAAQKPDLAADLQKQLAAWRESVNADMPTKNPDHDPARAHEWGKPK